MFDKSRLNETDYHELNSAISRAAPKVRFWYSLSNAWQFAINQNAIAEQTRATSDYDKLHKEHDLHEDEYNSKRIHLTNIRNKKFHLSKLLGLKDTDICAYNPQNPIPEIKVGRRTAQLIQIDGLGWGNTYNARINFEKGTAFLNEDDQDIAHRLGLIYTPTGIIEVDALKPSDFEMHRNKTKTNDTGNMVLYCDNRSCQKRVRNPILVIDEQTGGLYHSDTCFWKDMSVKAYLSQEREDLTIEPIPKRIQLEEAVAMYERGELQQSPEPRTTEKFRSLNPWPEVALLSLL